MNRKEFLKLLGIGAASTALVGSEAVEVYDDSIEVDAEEVPRGLPERPSGQWVITEIREDYPFMGPRSVTMTLESTGPIDEQLLLDVMDTIRRRGSVKITP